ncbi:MAG: DinB family protein [Dehalococcoidia bacterium]|nr:DinB family protein [Dehalococcoidia bacterium]
MDTWLSIRLLASTPAKLNTLAAPLTEQQLRWRPSAGEWSIKEVLCHLRDTCRVHTERMRRVAGEDNPTLPAWDEQAAARDHRYQDGVTEVILPAYTEARLSMVELLSALPPEALLRPRTHAETGRLTLESLVAGTAGHDRDHLAQLRQLRAGAITAGV